LSIPAQPPTGAEARITVVVDWEKEVPIFVDLSFFIDFNGEFNAGQGA
jgi:hypothetical protein